jgi:hypothetical protein
MNGAGTVIAPWEITTAAHLLSLASFVNAGNGSLTAGKYYKLMNDVDFHSIPFQSFLGWDPIGDNIRNNATFQGNFDGNNKVVANFRTNRTSQDYLGLFGYIFHANIHNLKIETCDITGNRYVGGLVGQVVNSTIENCYVNGSVTGAHNVGGLIGYIDNSTIISNNYADCIVRGNSDVGGLIGTNYGTIRTSYSEGIVYDTDRQAGGFVGCNYSYIFDCYAIGGVTGNENHIGGFAGVNKEGTISYCYATGGVTGTINADYIGGFTGMNTAILTNCVAANNTVTGGISNVNRVAGTNGGIVSNNYAFVGMVINPIGGVSGISQNMATLMSFNFYNSGSNWYNNTPWSIDIVSNPLKSWKICDGQTLPFLQWEGINCSPIPPDTCSFDAYGGDGSQGNPYQIYFPCQLADLATFVNNGNGAQTLNKYFKLMNNIDLSAYSTGQGWEPIGYFYSYNNIPFQFNGDFDGNGKIITNLKINRNAPDKPVGFFGCTTNATIHDIGIENCYIIGGFVVGSLIGDTYKTTIRNCYSTGIVTSTGSQAQRPTGGLVGDIYYYSILENSYSTCDVIGAGTVAGGLVGQQSQYGTINNCYATGNVSGSSSVGGIVGLHSSISSIIKNCVAANTLVNSTSGNYTNRITGSGGIGLSNNYAYEGMLVNGATVNGGTHNNVNGENKPMSTLMSYNFYNTGSNWYNNIPWSIDVVLNLTKIWRINDGHTLPFFQWQ